MKLIDLTLPTPEENLACDEALLDDCEERDSGEILRFWQPAGHFVVVGYSNDVAREVNLAACAAAGVPILRRCSGGGTVLQGPGCLNYALVLRIGDAGPLQTITGANRLILGRHRDAIERAAVRARRQDCWRSPSEPADQHKSGDDAETTARFPEEITVEGHTDLAIAGRKFSGNSQRRKRRYLLFHGCFLLGLDFALVEQCLQMPSKQPGYRRDRSHTEFLVNVSASPERIKAALISAWGATESDVAVPHERIAALVRQRYSVPELNLRSRSQGPVWTKR